LNSNLYWSSLRPVYATHDCVIRISDGRVASFTFDDIYLPYQGIGRYGSVTYSIKQNDDLASGTEIKNTADIYFDFNEPIITNTVTNTILWPENVDQHNTQIPICIFSNPTNQSFPATRENVENVIILNNLGQIVLESSIYNGIFIENLDSGIYFVKIKTAKETIVKKLIKQ